jgi:Apea-like HEPN
MSAVLEPQTAGAFLSALSELAKAIAPALQVRPVPKVSGPIVAFSEKGEGVTMYDGLVDEPGFLIGNVWQWIQSLPQYAVLRDVVIKSEIMTKNFATDASSGTTFRDDVLQRTVSTLLNAALLPSFVFDEQRIACIFRQMVVELEKASFTYVVRAYFRFAGPRLQTELPFTRFAKIRPLDNDERIRLVRSLRHYEHRGPTALDATAFQTVLELRFESDDSNILRAQPPRPLEDFQTALRLAFGRVAFAFATIDLDSVFRLGYRHILMPFRDSSRLGGPLSILPNVEMTAESLSRANHVFERLVDSPNARSLKTAIRRYSDTLERSRLDDALIDCVVGLESILNQDSTIDVTRRLRQRLALMIGMSVEDRVNVYDEVKKIYDARSKIAHGDEPKQPLPTLFDTAEQYLGRLLRRMLEDQSQVDLKALDVSLVRGDAVFAAD